MNKRYLPDYSGAGIVNLMASIASRFGHRTGHPQLTLLPASALKPYKKVVLLVIDGLGYHFLEKQSKYSQLRSHLCGPMTSVFPSTTASGVSTYATAQPPSRHAITGWFVHLKELGVVSKILFGEPRFGGSKFSEAGIGMRDIICSRPVADKLKAQSYLITPGMIADSQFSEATRGKAMVMPYDDLPGMFRMMRKTLKTARGDSFIYAYWPELDHLCHLHGVDSREARAHFGELDRMISIFGRSVKEEGAILLVTADHGLIDTPEANLIQLSDHPELMDCLSLPLCGEPRVAYCYVYPEKVPSFKRYVAGRLRGKCRLLSRRQVMELGLYGPAPADPKLADRVGDFVLIMEDGFCLRDFISGEKRFYLKANHGGMTFQEMMVPLIKIS